MFKTRFLLLIFFLVLSFAWLSSSGVWKKFTSRDAVSRLAIHETDDPWFEKARVKAEDARRFVAQKGYNDVICFLIDMSLPSGQNRFFIYDLKKDTLKNSGLGYTWPLQSILAGRKKIWQYCRMRLYIPWKI